MKTKKICKWCKEVILIESNGDWDYENYAETDRECKHSFEEMTEWKGGKRKWKKKT